MTEARNDDGFTFKEWMKKVDGHVARQCGLSANDLPDQSYWDWWNDSIEPSTAAYDALEDAGFPFDELEFID